MLDALTRWTPKEYKQGLCEDPDGEYLERSDVVALIAELEARLAEAERVIEPFADPSSGDTEGNDDDHCDVAVSKGELRALRAWTEKANG